jgi:two-component system response regulator QseB
MTIDVILVEDDLDLGSGVRIALTDQGMNTVWVRRFEDAQRLLDSDCCDLVLLDLGLPDGNGLNLLTRLRQEKRDLPVLILTARDALADRLQGLDNGADDYLVKPFALAELLSRVRALARRAYGFEGETLELRGLSIHVPTMRVTVDGRAVELSRSEFQLLNMLAKRADRVITRHALEAQLQLRGTSSQSNTLEVHISNIRRKIGASYIKTVRGVGYVIYRDETQAPFI